MQTKTSPSSLLFFAVPDQSERDQDQERGGPPPEPHKVLPRTVQVRTVSPSSIFYAPLSTLWLFRDIPLINGSQNLFARDPKETRSFCFLIFGFIYF